MDRTQASTIVAADPAAQARTALIWKTIEYLGLALFLVSVPRWMGPDLYGRFATLNAALQILMMLNGLGALVTFGRFTPDYAARGPELVNLLFMQVLLLRSTVALFLAVALVGCLPMLLPEATFATRIGVAGALVAAAIASTCYQIFYGLNRLGRWLTNGSSKRLVLIGVLALLGGWKSLERAAFSLLAAELVLLGLGSYWARGFFAWGREVLELRRIMHYLRFSLPFFATNLALILIWRAGELIVMVFTGAPVEVAHFSVAASIAAALAALLGQLAMMVIPRASALEASAEAGRADQVLGQSLRYLTVAATLVALSLHVVDAALLSTLLGEGYAPVLASLRIMALALIPVGFVRTAMSAAVVRSQPRRAAWLGAGLLVGFVAVGAVLVPESGSQGAALALVCAMIGAGLVGYSQLSAPVRAGARTLRLVASSSIAAAVMVQADAAPAWSKLMWIAGYCGSLPILRILPATELARLARAIGGRADR